jgi:ketosteroid isomerase-like protein
MKLHAMLLVVALGNAGCEKGVRRGSGADRAALEEQVRLASLSFQGAVLANSEANIEALVTDDVVLLDPFGRLHEGSWNAARVFTTLFSNERCRAQFVTESLVVADTLAFELGRTSVCWDDVVQSKEVRYTRVWAYRSDSWKIRTFTWTADIPPPVIW